MTTTHSLDDRWAAAGPGDEDIAYRTQSLKFSNVDLALDESVPFMTLFRMWLYAAIVSWTVFWLFAMFAFVALISGASSGTSDSSGYDSSGLDGVSTGLSAGHVIIDIGILLSFAVFWIVLLAAKIQEPVAEWKTLLEGKAAAAESSYAAIYYSLARRRIPLGVSPSRIRTDVLNLESVNNRLAITERSYVAYVSVFGFGTSLYVGWTMWRSRRGAVLVGQFIKDLIASMLGRSGIVHQMLRTERVRAMREAVHSAVREGVDAAIAGINMPIAATFGYEIPIESITPAAPVPPMAQTAPGQPVRPPVEPTASWSA